MKVYAFLLDMELLSKERVWAFNGEGRKNSIYVGEEHAQKH